MESIARDHGLTVDQLARFNWNTTDPREINDRLRSDVGATRRPAGSRLFVFDDSNDPGIILVPSGFREAGLETDRQHTIRVVERRVDPNLITCCRIPGITFAYDKSFIRPSVAFFLKRLEPAIEQHSDAKIIIFGHTDRCGPELYNKKLSERRAKSAYALITDQPEIWEDLYQLERWGEAVLRSILSDLGFDSGPANDRSNGDFEAAVRAYQDSKPELASNGTAGPETRRAMFLDYMTGKHDIRLTDEQFIEPKFMGCGEFNPLVEPNEHELANDGRGEPPGNEENRRVVFYLFRRPPREIPCRLRDLGPCRSEMAKHPDHRSDRSPKPPFACAFYDAIGFHCACEHSITTRTARIRLFDTFDRPLPSAPYAITIEGETFEGTTDEDAWATVRIQAAQIPDRCMVRWGEHDANGDHPHESEIFLTFGDLEEDQALQRRLHNLGFRSDESLEKKVIGFQLKFGLEATGREVDVKETVQVEHDESFKTSAKLFADLERQEDESSSESDFALA